MSSTAPEDRPFIFRVNNNGAGPALLIQVIRFFFFMLMITLRFSVFLPNYSVGSLYAIRRSHPFELVFVTALLPTVASAHVAIAFSRCFFSFFENP